MALRRSGWKVGSRRLDARWVVARLWGGVVTIGDGGSTVGGKNIGKYPPQIVGVLNIYSSEGSSRMAMSNP